MRVLFYVGDKQWSGAARAVLASARGLAARGAPVTIACCAGSRLDTLSRAAEIDTVPINTASSTAGGAWDLRKIIKDRFVEVVVVTTERDQLVVSSARLFADRGAVLRRKSAFEDLQLRRGGRLSLKLAASGVIATTEAELAALDRTGWRLEPSVVPLGIDAASYDAVEPAPRHELGAPADSTIVACHYDDSSRYRIASVFRTLALLGPRHAHLHAVVFGPGSRDETLRMHASALGVGSRVTFLGETEDDRRIMRAATVGWIVSSADNAVYGLLDFMALRIPVIADRAPLGRHYVVDGSNGMLLTPGDAAHVASNVAAFLASREKLTAMGNAARTRVQREFTEQAAIDAMERAVTAAGDRTKWIKT